jgi:hypothetical protein
MSRTLKYHLVDTVAPTCTVRDWHPQHDMGVTLLTNLTHDRHRHNHNTLQYLDVYHFITIYNYALKVRVITYTVLQYYATSILVKQNIAQQWSSRSSEGTQLPTLINIKQQVQIFSCFTHFNIAYFHPPTFYMEKHFICITEVKSNGIP